MVTPSIATNAYPVTNARSVGVAVAVTKTNHMQNAGVMVVTVCNSDTILFYKKKSGMRT